MEDDTNEARLAAFFAADPPPAVDHVFEARIALGVSRARLWEAALDALAPLAVCVGLLWALGPSLAVWLAQAGAMVLMAGAVAFAAGSLWLMRRAGWLETAEEALWA